MRFFAAVSLALAALSSSGVSARVLHSLLARGASDTCGNLNGPLVVMDPHTRAPVNVGKINTCLCYSDVPAFITTNSVAKAAVAFAGKPATTQALMSMISTQGKTCTYPDAAVPQCKSSDACGFTCGSGFTAFPPGNPTTCLCPPPMKVCSGQCVSKASCPSSVPVKRDLSEKKCYKGLTACGVYSSRLSQSWECVDTKSDLESCGGCAVPLSAKSPRGIDCTAIQGVADVACVSGSCRVERCLSGYTRSADKSFCVRNADLELLLEHNVLASDYGLEHTPFARNAD